MLVERAALCTEYFVPSKDTAVADSSAAADHVREGREEKKERKARQTRKDNVPTGRRPCTILVRSAPYSERGCAQARTRTCRTPHSSTARKVPTHSGHGGVDSKSHGHCSNGNPRCIDAKEQVAIQWVHGAESYPVSPSHRLSVRSVLAIKLRWPFLPNAEGSVASDPGKRAISARQTVDEGCRQRRKRTKDGNGKDMEMEMGMEMSMEMGMDMTNSEWRMANSESNGESNGDRTRIE